MHLNALKPTGKGLVSFMIWIYGLLTKCPMSECHRWEGEAHAHTSSLINGNGVATCYTWQTFDYLACIHPGCLPITLSLTIFYRAFGYSHPSSSGNIMLLSFIPSALLQNSLNCDRKYLDNKISSVEITRQMGADRAEDREEEKEEYFMVLCGLWHCFPVSNTVWEEVIYFSEHLHKGRHFVCLVDFAKRVSRTFCW